MIVAPNSPIPRAKASAAPAPRPPAASGRATRKNTRPCPAPSVRAAAGSVGSMPSRAAHRRSDVERACDECDRENDRDLGERDVDPECVERTAEQAEPSERRKQADPGNGRRQHERKLDQRDDEIAGPRCPCRHPVGGRCAEQENQGHRHGIRLGGDNQRVLCGIRAESGDKVGRRHAQEDSRDRQQQKEQGDARRKDERRPEQPVYEEALGSGRKPALFSAAWPLAERIPLTHASAAALLADLETTAIS